MLWVSMCNPGIAHALFAAASCMALAALEPEAQAQAWPTACASAESFSVMGSRRVYAVAVRGSASGCQSLSLAIGALHRDRMRAKELVQRIPEPLSQIPEVRWLEGRIALAEGRPSNALAELRPVDELWPKDPYAIWDLGVAAGALREDALAREAYRRVRLAEQWNERQRLAVALELAAIESRFGPTGIASARSLVQAIDASDTDPDSCPWVEAMRTFLDGLDSAPRRSGACSRPAFWFRSTQSVQSGADVFASVARSDDWLRLPRDERLAIVAMGLGATQLDLRRRLWSGIEAPSGSALFELRQRELKRLAMER